MRCDVVLALALLVANRSDPVPAPQTGKPPSAATIPSHAPIVAPATPAPTLQTLEPAPRPNAPASTDAAPVEHLSTFDAAKADLDWSFQGWRLLADGAPLKDFGRSEWEARQALHLIRELRLNQHGVIGGPTPSLEYWLSDGKAPLAPTHGLRMQQMDATSLRVEQTQGQWVVRDDQHILFDFGREETDARQTLTVIRKYGFTQVGAIGPGSPSMMVFFAQPDALTTADPLSTHHSRAMEPKRDATRDLGPSSPGAKSLAAHADSTLNGMVLPTVPPLRQSTGLENSLASTTQNPDRTPFDFRQVQLVQEKTAWKLAAGSCVLADFGSDEHAARQGLAAMQYYRFTEQCHMGDSPNRFTCFFVSGQAPRGTMFGVDGLSFQPERLEVRQVGGKWAVCAGEQPLVEMGDKPDGAKEVLDLIRRQQCDRLFRLGSVDGKGMMFLVRSR